MGVFLYCCLCFRITLHDWHCLVKDYVYNCIFELIEGFGISDVEGDLIPYFWSIDGEVTFTQF